MKKLFLLWLFITYPFIMLNAQLQQNRDSISEKIPDDSIFILKTDTSYTTFNKPIQFTSFIQLRVHGLAKLLQLSLQQRKPIQLYFDGIEMSGIAPFEMDKSHDILCFILKRDFQSMKQWKTVRRILLEKRDKKLAVSVGLKGEYAYPSTLHLPAELSRTGDYYLAFLSGTFLIIMFSFMVKRSNILRNKPRLPTDTYSLSKTLIAFWVFIILFSILFLLATINSLPHITKSAIFLFVISVVTTLIAKTIDFFKQHKTNPASVSSIDFLRDIISDTNGISLYRLQLVLFTILTGSYFIFIVVSEMLLPVFETSFLILYCISHGIYLSFKCFEINK